jgi:hypothetical protein
MARAEGLKNNIGRRGQAAEQAAPIGGIEVERGAAF